MKHSATESCDCAGDLRLPAMSVIPTTPQTLDDHQQLVIDKSVIKGDFAFDNCEDIHIGPKYENSNNITIHQNICLPSGNGILRDLNLKTLANKDVQNNKGCKYQTYIVLATLAFALILVTTFYKFHISDHYSNPPFTMKPSFTENPDDYPVELQFVLRESWGASPPVAVEENNTLPIGRVIFIHTASSQTCNKYTACAKIVQNIQELHMDEDHKWGDIGYNFIVGSDGYIYVGRGWEKVGVHTSGFNHHSMAIAFIGDFRTDIPNNQMISSAIRLLDFGTKRNKLSKVYQLFGQCQLHSAFPYSPGKNVIKVIREWPHWNSTNNLNCVQ